MKYLFKLCLLAAVLLYSGNTNKGSFKKIYGEGQGIITSRNQRNPFNYTADHYSRLIQKREELGFSIIRRSSKGLNASLNILKKPDGLSFSIGKLWGLVDRSTLSSSADETPNDFIARISHYDHKGYVALCTYIAEYKDKVSAFEIFTGAVKGILLSCTAIMRNTLFDSDLFKFLRPTNMVDEFKDEDYHLVTKELIVWLSVLLWSDYP